MTIKIINKDTEKEMINNKIIIIMKEITIDITIESKIILKYKAKMTLKFCMEVKERENLAIEILIKTNMNKDMITRGKGTIDLIEEEVKEEEEIINNFLVMTVMFKEELFLMNKNTQIENNNQIEGDIKIEMIIFHKKETMAIGEVEDRIIIEDLKEEAINKDKALMTRNKIKNWILDSLREEGDTLEILIEEVEIILKTKNLENIEVETIIEVILEEEESLFKEVDLMTEINLEVEVDTEEEESLLKKVNSLTERNLEVEVDIEEEESLLKKVNSMTERNLEVEEDTEEEEIS
jgi:hypothetical protein